MEEYVPEQVAPNPYKTRVPVTVTTNRGGSGHTKEDEIKA